MSTTDVKAALNAVLATKPFVTIQSTHPVSRTKCTRPTGGRDKADPFCETVTVQEPIIISIPATVTETYILGVKGIEFGTVITTGLPESVRMVTKVIENDADASVTSSIALSVAATETWSIAKTNGFSITRGGSVTVTCTFPPYGSAGATFSYSEQVSTSTTTQEGGQRTITRSTNDSVTIGPRRGVRIQLIAYESTASIPFKATVIVNGDLAANLSNLTTADQILTEAERTFYIEGSITVTAVSEGWLSVRDLGEIPKSVAVSSSTRIEEFTQHIPTALHTDNFKYFTTPANASRKDAQIQPLHFFHKGAAGKPTLENDIGPPDGTHYEILYTVKEYRPTAGCGFNDIGAMNVGVFSIEAREYSTYANGTLLAQWQERVESFESCWSI